MSRGLHAKYKLIKTEHGIAYYAYGGSNFSFPYDQDIWNAMDGRIQLSASALNGNIADAIISNQIQITKPCYYAEFNFEGYDLFALKTIRKIIVTCRETGQWPGEGFWVC